MGWCGRAFLKLTLAHLTTAMILLLTLQAGVAVAQPASKVPRIGYISPGSPSNQARVARLEAFRQGLREQGYVDGQNIAIDARWAQGNYDRYAELATEPILSNPASPGTAPQLRVAEALAPTLGVRLQVLEARTPQETDQAFVAMGMERAGALVVLAESMFTNQAKQIADQSVKMRLPTIFGLKEHADAGGLVVYGADPVDMERRAAGFVAKILKGAKPADLPVEQPSKLELIINLKTAKALGLTIPQSVLLRADQVIQ